MAQEVVIRKGKTLRFNLSIAKSFNADFDFHSSRKQGKLKVCNPLVRMYQYILAKHLVAGNSLES